MKEKYKNLIPEIAQKCSETEAFAKRNSREFENMYIAYYMQDFIGEKFKASIYKISKTHISIYIKDVMITGKIKISSILNNSTFQPIYYNNELIIDENNILRVFDNLTVTLVDIDKSTNNILFEIA